VHLTDGIVDTQERRSLAADGVREIGDLALVLIGRVAMATGSSWGLLLAKNGPRL